jgi:glycosyltransferase involved in cell wall biosynthesis
MRILHLISSGGYYGAENMIVNLANGLTSLGHSNVIAVFQNLQNPNLELADEAQKRGLSITVIPCGGRFDFRVPRLLRSYIREHNIDVVHTHGYKANFYGWLGTRRLDVTLVATCHNWTRGTAILRAYALLDFLVLRGFQQVVAVSSEIAEELRKLSIPSERIRFIPNGVEIGADREEQFTPGTPRELVIGSVGRMVPEKGFQYLIEAAPAVLAKFPNAKLLLIGDGPFRASLEKLAEQLEIRSRIIFTGKQRDMKRVYDSLNIFVLPSLAEGMPMVILEAMEARKAIIATSVGSIPALIIPEKTGLLVKPGDRRGLQNAVLRLLGDPQLSCSLGREAQSYVRQKYSLVRMAEQYSALYQELRREAPCSATHVVEGI